MVINYYQVLGLDINATKIEIKKAYRKYATKYHPDKQNGDEFFEERFKEVQKAYEILSDDIKRANYDLKLKHSSSEYFSGQNYQKKNNSKETRENKEKESEKSRREQKNREEERARKKREEKQKIRKEEERKKNEREQRIKEQNIKKKRNTIFYTSKKISVNGLYINLNGESYLIENYDFATIRKDDDSGSIGLGIFLIIIGIVTIAFFIGTFLLILGIYALFHREYYVVLINEYGDVPLLKGRKRKMKKIAKRINKAINMK